MGQQVGQVLSDVTGASTVAEATGNAANAQLAQQRADRELALKQTPEQLQALQEAITTNSQDIARKQKLLASSDPALIEAGKQATELLQGKAAASLAPLQNQRAQQRASLEQTLRQQLGSDYATSTAGIQALNNFDQQTSNVLNQAQQQSLGQLLGIAQNTSNTTGNTGSNVSASQNLFNSIGNQRNNAISLNPISAGNAFAGQLAQATSNNKLFMTAAGATAGAFAGGGLGASLGSQIGSSSAPSGGAAQNGLGNYGGNARSLFGLEQ